MSLQDRTLLPSTLPCRPGAHSSSSPDSHRSVSLSFSQYPSARPPPPVKRNLTLVEFMSSLQKTCLARQESWWSYEVCFGALNQGKELIPADSSALREEVPTQFQSGARQFRANTIVTQEGKKVSYSQVQKSHTLTDSVSHPLFSHRSSRQNSFWDLPQETSIRTRLLSVRWW
jgi:hypothetical protein